MKKKIVVDKSAAKELKKFDKKVRAKIDARVKILQRDGKLEEPFGKKIDTNLYEIRIKLGGQWRVLYAYLQEEFIILLSAFLKKTQKTPPNEMIKAKKRLERYES